jgi:hypothetical protein
MSTCHSDRAAALSHAREPQEDLEAQEDPGPDAVREYNEGCVREFYLRFNEFCVREAADARFEINKNSIDTIDSAIVAKVKAEEVLPGAPYFACHALQVMREPNKRSFDIPMVEDEVALAELVKQRGVPKTRDVQDDSEETKLRVKQVAAIISEQVERALLYLKDKSDLYENTDPARVRSVASAFFVAKADGTRRVITDGRLSNTRFAVVNSIFRAPPRFQQMPKFPEEVPASLYNCFNLFSLETLMQVVSSVSHQVRELEQPQFFVAHLDFRHWFHQIAMPQDLKAFFATRVWNGRYFEWLVPRATPMGWMMAPWVGQSCTWSILLRSSNKRPASAASSSGATQPQQYMKNYPKGLNLSDDYIHRLRDKGLPDFIPLRAGGGVFVLIDNALIISPREDVVRFWIDHILERVRQVHATLKRSTRLPFEIPINARGTTETDIHFVKLTAAEGEEAYFDFAGVRFKFGARQVARQTVPPSAVLSTLVNDERWTGSHEQLASILGRINWYKRVAGVKQFTREHRELCALYAYMQPPAGKRWIDKVDIKDEARLLAKIWKESQPTNDEWTAYEQMLFIDKNATKVSYWATDASGDGIAIVQLGATPRACVTQAWPRASDTGDMSLFTRPEGQTSIATRELAAIYLAVEKATCGACSATASSSSASSSSASASASAFAASASSSTQCAQLIVVATDSQNAKQWIENSAAHNDHACLILERLHHKLRSAGCLLMLTYVNTVFNVADEPSRNFPSNRDIDQSCLHHCLSAENI